MSIVAADLAKRLKDRRLFRWWNTDASVADRDLRIIVGLIGRDADSSSLGGALHCIGKKIEKNLFALPLVADVFATQIIHIIIQRNAVLDGAVCHGTTWPSRSSQDASQQ